MSTPCSMTIRRCLRLACQCWTLETDLTTGGKEYCVEFAQVTAVVQIPRRLHMILYGANRAQSPYRPVGSALRCSPAADIHAEATDTWHYGRTEPRTTRSIDMSRHRLPLTGVRVLELGNYIAAPTAGRMLADFGAEVIKVERPETGDEIRNWRLKAGTTSMLYRTINRNKKSVELDLRSEEGREAVIELVRRSDIMLENFRPGTLEKWGLGPDVLEEANPELVFVRISAFGQTGPMSSRPGFAAVAEGYSGFRELVGDPDRPPVRVGISIGDSIAGMQAAFGAVMMLFDRQRQKITGAAEAVVGSAHSFEGEGPLSERTVDVALNEAMFSVMESLVPDYSAFGEIRTRTGGRMEGIAPSNGYLCAGGKSVVIAGNGDGIFGRLMNAIDRPDLAEDAELQTNAGRWERREELDE